MSHAEPARSEKPNKGGPAPVFSIVVPVYNRAREIPRAIDSCIRQSFAAFELIIVDDASTDHTAKTVQSYSDRRIRLMGHVQNRGVCPARATGVNASVGEWIIFLDSDDELAPDILGVIWRYTQGVQTDVCRIASMCCTDDGRLSPRPWKPGILDYEGYIRWTETAAPSDFNNCIRRETFDRVRLPEGRGYETLYHLDFAKQFRTLAITDVAVIVHSDAANRVTNLNLQRLMQRHIGDAPSAVLQFVEILKRHGPALRRWAPRRHRIFARALITSRFLAGEYRAAIAEILRYLREDPVSREAWVLLFLGIFGRRAVAFGRVVRTRLG